MFNFFSKKSSMPEELFFHTDIHCHLIPGIDDGSPSVRRSVYMIERMMSWGINRIIASPHVTEGTFENTPETIDAALQELKAGLDEKGININLSHSAEYRLDDLFQRHLDDDIIVPLPGNFLLVENSFIQEPWGLDQTLFDLKIKGFNPILAHPERYEYYYSRRDRYKALHDAGTLFQVNLLSLAGNYGKEQRKVAEWMIDNELVDFIGTDIHTPGHVEAIEAYLKSKDYRRDAQKLRDVILNDKI